MFSKVIIISQCNISLHPLIHSSRAIAAGYYTGCLVCSCRQAIEIACVVSCLAVCAGRTEHWLAPARQREAVANAEGPARPGQYGGGGGAR